MTNRSATKRTERTGLVELADGNRIRGVDVAGSGDLRYFQHVDGVYPWPLHDFNDWHTIGYGTCISPDAPSCFPSGP